MHYEVKSKVPRINARGVEKDVVEVYLVRDCETFTEAEDKSGQYLAAENVEYDIFAITRSNVIEIVNERKGYEPFYKAKIEYVFVEDSGKEKTKYYHVLVAAKDLREANVVMENYMAQCLDNMKLDGIVKTKILELL